MKFPKAYSDPDEHVINVIIETPTGSRTQDAIDPKAHFFQLK